MAAITLEDELNKSQDEPTISSIEGMTAVCSPNINEVSTQGKYKNEMYRPRFDLYLSLCQHNARPRTRRCQSMVSDRLIAINTINNNQ